MTCKNCDTYKAELEKYKKKYEMAKSGLTDEERKIIVELICNEQVMNIVPNYIIPDEVPDDKKDDKERELKRYDTLEQLKIKIRTV